MSKPSLPNGWRRFQFGDLAESITERVEDPKAAGVEIYVGLEHLDSDTTKISRYGTPEDVESTKLRFYPGDVIYARRRAYQRKLGVAEVEGICSAHALVLRARPEVCLPEFLPYFLQSDQFHERALSISVGSLSPTINWKTLFVQEFVLPPIAEQRRIIQLLESVDELMKAQQQIPFAQQRDAMLSDLLKIDSRSLRSVRLNEISTISYGYTESAFQEIVGPKFLRITDIQDGAVDWESVPYCRIDDATFAKQKLKDGDIVFARTGTVGKSFLVQNPPEAVSASYLIRVQADREKVIPEFLFLNFQTREYWKQIHAGKSGSVQGGFNASKLGKLEIPLPPLAKQFEIIEAMAALQTVELKTIHSLKQLSVLRNSLLNKQLSSGITNV